MRTFRIYFYKQKMWIKRELVLETYRLDVAKELVKMLREKYPADRFFIVEIDERIVDYE